MIYINDIASFRDPEKNFFTPDDRQEKIETIGGIVVQDLGRVIEGDVLALQCMFTAANYARLEELWIARTKATYTDIDGQTYSNMRVVIKDTAKDKDFPNCIMVTFEPWRK